MNLRLTSLIAALLLTACATQGGTASIGEYPGDYREVVIAHIKKTFYDPYSIRSAGASHPAPGQYFFQYGWIVCVEMNAKNRMGGYTGVQRTAFLLRNSAVVATVDKAPLCAQASVVPWPELEQIK